MENYGYSSLDRWRDIKSTPIDLETAWLKGYRIALDLELTDTFATEFASGFVDLCVANGAFEMPDDTRVRNENDQGKLSVFRLNTSLPVTAARIIADSEWASPPMGETPTIPMTNQTIKAGSSHNLIC